MLPLQVAAFGEYGYGELNTMEGTCSVCQLSIRSIRQYCPLYLLYEAGLVCLCFPYMADGATSNCVGLRFCCLSWLKRMFYQRALVALSTAPLISYLYKKFNFPSSEAAATVFVTI